jgi:hypothetical protein
MHGTSQFKPWIREPHIVLRRVTARFFGKILKVDLIVTLHAFPTLPALCRLPAEALRSMVAGLWMSLVVACVLLFPGDSAWPQQLVTSPAQTQAPAQAGPAESIYRKNAAAPAAPVAAPMVDPVAVPVADQAAQAERIVAAALAAMGRAESISARVRQRVRIDDRVLVGAGRYVQSGLGEDQRYRYESSMKSDTETFDLLEVCDGLFAWSYRRIGPQPPQLERLDVRRIRERLHQLKPADDVVAAPYVGGVQRTLSCSETGSVSRRWSRPSSMICPSGGSRVAGAGNVWRFCFRLTRKPPSSLVASPPQNCPTACPGACGCRSANATCFRFASNGWRFRADAP